MTKEHIWMFAIVIGAVLVAMYLSTKLKMNSFDEFESVG